MLDSSNHSLYLIKLFNFSNLEGNVVESATDTELCLKKKLRPSVTPGEAMPGSSRKDDKGVRKKV